MDHKALFSQMLGQKILSVESVAGGKNSKIFKIVGQDSVQYAVKHYFQHSLDVRNRLKVEYSALQFLWNNGVRCIARPVAFDSRSNYAIYEFIDGQKISALEVNEADIDCAVEFLVNLKGLERRQGSRDLPPASEACFSIQSIVENIGFRLGRLSALQDGQSPNQALNFFLQNEFQPLMGEIVRWVQATALSAQISFSDNLDWEERTLSPSDFGFHNALRRNDGSLVFLDFEYFGWDDPAKMVADFILHPAQPLQAELKRRFVTKILAGFPACRNLAQRVELVYPLFGLKWCIILLNEFVPEHWQRRRFAGDQEQDLAGRQTGQLAKARDMLDRIRKEYGNFPYRQ